MASHNIDRESGFKFKLFSHRNRKPADLLYRALAHIENSRFELRCLDVDDSPRETSAFIRLSPKTAATFDIFSMGRRVSGRHKRLAPRDAALTIRVLALDDTQHQFDVEYTIVYGSHIDLLDFETVASLSETIVLNLFLQIPGIAIERHSIVIGAQNHTSSG